MTKDTNKTNFPQEQLNLSKQEFPAVDGAVGMTNVFTSLLSNVGDRVSPWGRSPYLRDQQLRDFWPTEPFLAGAIYAAGLRNAAFEWEIQAKSTKLEQALTDMLNSSIASQSFGWTPLLTTLSTDLYTQDNGMFIELIRDPVIDAASRFKDERAPVIGIAHLDAGACTRTGNPEIPVIYTDYDGKDHKMKWWQVISVAEFPSPIQRMRGIGYSAVTRALVMAQIMQSIEKFRDEKIGGRHYKAIHLVSGPAKQEIEDTMIRGQEEADNSGAVRFVAPAIVASLDPEKPVSHVQIDLASLPDGFDIDSEMKWYISNIALNLGMDYQDLAPLPSGNIGSAEQSEILHRKSRGKGPAWFMETIQNVFRDYGVIPSPAKFVFTAKDMAEEMEQAQMKKAIAESLVILRRADIVDGTTGRKLAIKSGLFEEEDISEMEEGFGDEPALAKTDQVLGKTGANTVAEDGQRTKGFLGNIFKRGNG